MNTVTINFIPCSPPPAGGYLLTWRVAGSGDLYTDGGFFTTSPVVFTDSLNPPGTCYEGFLQSNCTESGESGELLGNGIPWSTSCAESGVGDYALEQINTCDGSPTTNYRITGANIGDVITVRAFFSGTIKRNTGLFTRAQVQIFSVNGTSDGATSACYTTPDSSNHLFSITADTVITAASDTELFTVLATIFNSSGATSAMFVSIVDINGTPQSIQLNGCHGAISQGGVC